MDLLVRLKFTNFTGETTHELITKRSTCRVINEWYASHHTGDLFTVRIDGKKQVLDINGVMIK